MKRYHQTARYPATPRRSRCWWAAIVLTLVASGVAAEDTLNAEAEDVAEALGRLDQGFVIRGLRAGHGAAAVEGSSFRDAPDRTAGDLRPMLRKGAGSMEALPGVEGKDSVPGR